MPVFMHHFGETGSISRILEKYQINSGKMLWDENHKSLSAEIDQIKIENDNMHIEFRHLKGKDLNSLQPKELIMIEEALGNRLTSVHEKQMEHWDSLMKNGKMLEDENKLLAFNLTDAGSFGLWRGKCHF